MNWKQKIKAYLRKGNIERAQKDKQERVKQILDLIKKDKDPKEQIKTLERVTERYNLYLSDYKNNALKELQTVKYRVESEVDVIECYLGGKTI